MSFIPRSAIPSLNTISGSSASRTQTPHKIGYPDGWQTGKTQEWYESQPSKTFKYIQYRKEREAPFYHEFIVVELDNDTVCRFDRRGDGILDLLKDGPDYKAMNEKSDLLLRIHFPKGEDLLTVLAICYCVQKDEDARAYTLTKYNCYFLSWTIITATAR
ncbi:hypothetical protein BDV93DRAFT_458039, partial [Ceratobasidium sp. AG-I]